MITCRYQKSILDNGIRVVSETLDNTQSIAIGFWIASGSRFEKSRLNGISHLMEHMVFKGTEKRNALLESGTVDHSPTWASEVQWALSANMVLSLKTPLMTKKISGL